MVTQTTSKSVNIDTREARFLKCKSTDSYKVIKKIKILWIERSANEEDDTEAKREEYDNEEEEEDEEEYVNEVGEEAEEEREEENGMYHYSKYRY